MVNFTWVDTTVSTPHLTTKFTANLSQVCDEIVVQSAICYFVNYFFSSGLRK